MKIVSKNNAAPCTPARKFPGIYRDTRNGEITLMLAPSNGVVLRSGGGTYDRTAGTVGSFCLTDFDFLHDEVFEISNL